MPDVVGGGTTNVTLYDESGDQVGTAAKPLAVTVSTAGGGDAGVARDATIQETNASLGSDGASPPALVGTGVRGWLRALYTRLGDGSQRVTVDALPEVEVKNDAGSPLSVSVGNFPASTEIANDVGNPVPVSGTVAVSSIPEVEVKNDAGSPLSVSVGNFPASTEIANDVGNPVPVSGTVAVSSIPEVEVKNDAGNPLTTTVTVGGAATTLGNPQPVQQSIGGAAVSGTNPLPVDTVDRPSRRMGIGHEGPLRAFYASPAGGRVLYAATTGRVTLPGSTELTFMGLVNPANSGIDVYLARVELGMVAGSSLIYARYRNATLTSLPFGPRPFVNRGGGAASPAAALYYAPTRSGSTGVADSTTYLPNPAAFENNDVDGGIILRPGENLIWTTQGGAGNLGGSANASGSLVWWEVAAQ